MSSTAAQLRFPNAARDSSSGPEHHQDPVCEEGDDDDDLVAANITVRHVEDDPVDYETTCPGQSFTEEQKEKISLDWMDRRVKLNREFYELWEEIKSRGDDNVSFPPRPLRVLPETTGLCIQRGYCYHREYMTNNTCQTESTLGLRGPRQMMQIFSVKLSSYKSELYPISLYGIFAVRDDLEPLRNYVFNRSRDNPVMIYQDSFVLPLCSPCRGMYVLDSALLEVDLWVKKEGGKSNDEKLLSAYAEIIVRSCFDTKLTGRIHGDHCMLDMDYTLFRGSAETVIEGFKSRDSPHHVRFTAFNRYFDHEIVLFEGKCVEKGELFKHVVVVKAKEKLAIRLELDNSCFEWTFEDGAVGACNYPDGDPIFSQFHVRVFFAPKKSLECRPLRYFEWQERCRNKGSARLLE